MSSKVGNTLREEIARRDSPGRFEVLALSLPGSCDPGVPAAASRAGAVGVLDLSHIVDRARVCGAAETLSRIANGGATGLLIEENRGDFAREVLERVGMVDLLIVDPVQGSVPAGESWHGLARRVGLTVRRISDLRATAASGFDFLVAKGHEAGGRVGEETTFVLLQRLLAEARLPVYAWGGIGLRTAAACYAAGAEGVVLDWQLALLRESPAPARLRRFLEAMDGTETRAIPIGPEELYRIAWEPGALADCEGLCFDDEWARSLERLYRDPGPSAVDGPWPLGQDAALARPLARRTTSVGQAVRTLRSEALRAAAGAREAETLAANAPLARSHGTRYPLVQGPMTRVSDVPPFALALAREGALPFLALALMRKEEASRLLRETRSQMGDLPWGVGILGFVDRDTRAQQIEAMQEVRPPFALIAGGRPDQAKILEDLGITTYLHVPSPAMLETFLLEGARRFVFEGRECGGHVGPRTSFILWEQMLDTLLEAPLSPDERSKIHVLFAGGIHDGRSAAMVAALAQSLVEAGARIGLQIGTAYLFTEEIVATGALSGCFQEVARETSGTSLVETGPGHAIRCAVTDYVREFAAERERLRREAFDPESTREHLERMNLGRLRVASKAVKRRGAELVPVEAGEQRREGMFMIGQAAALRSANTTIAELHREICGEAATFLARTESEPAESAAHPAPAPFDIAIVGLGCLLPGAETAEEFWQNVIEARDAITEIPKDRFDVSRWFDPDPKAKDRIYSRWGGFLSDIPFDPLEFGIPPAAIPSIEPMQLLALVLVQRALRDAGYARDNPYRETTSVILGAGGGLADLGARYTTRAMLPGVVDDPGESLYATLPEWTEDSFAGILLNVISGRVSNRFDLGGSNFTVDAACASSLAAVYLACRELASGTSDMVIAGGCDTVQNPLSYLCFSKTSALSPTGRSKAFDADADGIVISEGLAAVVLKRREDAERDGDRIYAVIRAVAGGSDGRQRSLTAPSVEGQERTLSRAYRQAGFEISTVGLIEAHGTGTSLGDPTECHALSKALSRTSAARKSVAIGSVKSLIGHTKATAGIAGLIKATLAVHHRALPPTLHVRKPNPRAELGSGPLYVNTRLRPWVRANGPRRAAVSAFGFGGTNFHLVLEEYEGDLRRLDAPRRARKVEPFLLEALSLESLRDSVRNLARFVRERLDAGDGIDLAELAYSFHESRRPLAKASRRAAVVAASTQELLGQLDWLESTLSAGEGGAQREAPRGVYYAPRPFGKEAGLAFLFPGQGSQFVDMLGDLAVEFAEVRECFERADAALAAPGLRPLSSYVFPPPVFDDSERARLSEELKQTEVAQPALGACGVAMLRLVESFGLHPTMTAGHSYGELVALFAAGAFSEEALYRLSRDRGEAMAEKAPGERGSMLAVAAGAKAVLSALTGLEGVWIANLNGPRQTIVSGTAAGLQRAAEKLSSLGMSASPIPVALAFHSPLVAHARARFARALAGTPIDPFRLPVYNNKTAARYAGNPENVRALLAENLVDQVRFEEEILAMYEDGARVFLEIGPGGVLTKLVSQILEGRPHLAVATHPRDAEATTALAHALAAVAAQGFRVSFDRFFEGRGLESEGARSPRSSDHGHLWLVNGAYSRPASSPPRILEPAPLPAAPAPTTAPVLEMAPTPVDPASADALQEFQRTMRSFLETQEQVLRAFFGAAGSEAVGSREPIVTSTPATKQELLSLRTEPEPLNGHTPVEAPRDEEAKGTDLESVLLDIVSERTGYPKEMLARDSDLEAELGIDSIKRVEIIAACRRRIAPHLKEAPPWFMEEMTEARSLDTILKGLEKLVANTGSNGSRPVASPSVAASAGGGSNGTLARAARKTPSPAELESLLLSVVAERTGYPTEMLQLRANLEADLGIDSIKRVEIIAASRRKALPGLEAPPPWFMEEMTSARTLEAIRNGLVKLVAAEAASEHRAGTPSSAPASGREDAPVECPRSIPKPVRAPLVANPGFRLNRGVFVITDEESDVAPQLQSRIESSGGRARILGKKHLTDREAAQRAIEQVRSSDGPIAGVIHLRPLSSAPAFPGIDESGFWDHVATELKALLFLLQAVAPELSTSNMGEMVVLSASTGGGDFGSATEDCPHPWRGGLAGLLKTAQKEWPGARFRALDFDVPPSPALLLDELAAGGEVEIGYRDGARWALQAVRCEIEPEPPRKEAEPFREGSVVLVTGGARGITARVIRDLAARVRGRFLLLGRSEELGPEDPSTAVIPDAVGLRAHLAASLRAAGKNPSPRDVERMVSRLLAAREIRETLDAVRGAGSEAVYVACDVRDGEALARRLKELEGRFGPAQILVHGAGIIEDKNIVDKSGESFDRVLETKLAPILHFAKHLDASRLERVVLFSSVAGFYGNPGQGDYAAANEILNRLARALRRIWRAEIVSLNWGPWEGVGMVTPEVAKQFASRGIGMVTLEGGCRAVRRELELTGRDEPRVLVGPGPWVREEAASPRPEESLIQAGAGFSTRRSD